MPPRKALWKGISSSASSTQTSDSSVKISTMVSFTSRGSVSPGCSAFSFDVVPVVQWYTVCRADLTSSEGVDKERLFDSESDSGLLDRVVGCVTGVGFRRDL